MDTVSIVGTGYWCAGYASPLPLDTAYCLNPFKNKFYCFDDHEVRTVESNAIMVCAVELFLYDVLSIYFFIELSCLPSILYNC